MSNLNQINTTGRTSERANPLVGKPEKEVVSETVRIYESTYGKVRRIAFEENQKFVEVIQEAIDMLYESKKYHK